MEYFAIFIDGNTSKIGENKEKVTNLFSVRRVLSGYIYATSINRGVPDDVSISVRHSRAS